MGIYHDPVSKGFDFVENCAIDKLINGEHYSHTGVYGLFDYSHEDPDEETFPIIIEVKKKYLKYKKCHTTSKQS